MGKTAQKPKLVPHLNLIPHDLRTKWTATEVDLLAHAIIDKCNIKSSYDVMPIHYQKVESILPEDRRRNIISRQGISRIITRIAELLDETAPSLSSSTASSYIKWTSSEVRKLARALIEKAGVTSKDDVTVLLYHQVKTVLDPDRQRNIKQIGHLQDVIDEVPNMLRAIETEREEQRRVEEEAQRKLTEEEERKFTVTLPRGENVSKIGGILMLMMETLAAQLAEHFTESLHKELSGINDAEIARFLGMKTSKAVHKPRVVVAGLLAEQNTMIEQEFAKLLDIRTVAKDAPHQSVQDKIKTAKYVIGMTNFISHSLDATLAKHPNYRRHSGGMDFLRKILLEIYALEKDE